MPAGLIMLWSSGDSFSGDSRIALTQSWTTHRPISVFESQHSPFNPFLLIPENFSPTYLLLLRHHPLDFTVMKLFSEFRSCYRPQNTPASTAPPSDTDGHRDPDPASQRGRLQRSHWRPSLSVIMEDSVDQHRHTSVDKNNKSQKKLLAKPRSSLNTSCSFHTDTRTRNCIMPPVMVISPFSATPYMF
ncbi:uncharacterized protein LOC114743870 [Neltuma alba]|uniref:uncharacterized protein LOC114720155 n=1 Tax=Neltuma alba TaxID=207710 RepID=UPI0010A2F2B0|nr:uncharacterized protein LOC114720155 [Prosopis alba]XP_028787911.1 uncharacterized protein LOC114743870 [Prosopis alba]